MFERHKSFIIIKLNYFQLITNFSNKKRKQISLVLIDPHDDVNAI